MTHPNGGSLWCLCDFQILAAGVARIEVGFLVRATDGFVPVVVTIAVQVAVRGQVCWGQVVHRHVHVRLTSHKEREEEGGGEGEGEGEKGRKEGRKEGGRGG